MTPFAPFESDVPQRRPTTLPPAGAAAHPPISGPPALPTGLGRAPDRSTTPTEPSPDPITEIREQVASLHDALSSPDGLLHQLFAALERKAMDRHRELSDALLDVSARLAKLEPEVERHKAALTLLPPSHSGNGADHG